MQHSLLTGGPFGLGARERALLDDAVVRALLVARRRGSSVLASLTVTAPSGCDPSAVVAAARRAGEDWFCLEQPDRGGRALAALGRAHAIEARGARRFIECATAWRALVSAAEVGPWPAGPVPAAGGLVAVGGFAFRPDGASTPLWEGYEAASLVVPELALAREGDAVSMTLTAFVAPDDDPTAVADALDERARGLEAAPLPLLDPYPAIRATVSSAAPPEHYESSVARAVERIRAGALQKIVLARAVDVRGSSEHDPAAILGVLRDAFPSCSSFVVGRGDAAFVAASPELLVRREGQRASTLGLAGSTRRSADPAVDDHLGEQLLRSAKDREEHAIVVNRIARALRARSVWVTAAPEPQVVKMANIQHLATPIRAQLAEPVGAIDLAGLLHPTPAVGGEPWDIAEPLIPALEGLDRGWYAAPVGWVDAVEDGEFCVALRSALLRGRDARCYAGVGVVRDSDPGAELAETEVKLQALLPLLAGW
jgi:salicylate biosynthesis isochorismate synthase/menaquinone-specific isochorismate synthase